ncbi:hypothetical protein ACFL1H_07565 [Nanoarchaeota archaeon]
MRKRGILIVVIIMLFISIFVNAEYNDHTLQEAENDNEVNMVGQPDGRYLHGVTICGQKFECSNITDTELINPNSEFDPDFEVVGYKTFDFGLCPEEFTDKFCFEDDIDCCSASGFVWTKGAEEDKFGFYEDGRGTECCGDDKDEVYVDVLSSNYSINDIKQDGCCSDILHSNTACLDVYGNCQQGPFETGENYGVDFNGVETCEDGIDNDCDELIDYDDRGCLCKVILDIKDEDGLGIKDATIEIFDQDKFIYDTFFIEDTTLPFDIFIPDIRANFDNVFDVRVSSFETVSQLIEGVWCGSEEFDTDPPELDYDLEIDKSHCTSDCTEDGLCNTGCQGRKGCIFDTTLSLEEIGRYCNYKAPNFKFEDKGTEYLCCKAETDAAKKLLGDLVIDSKNIHTLTKKAVYQSEIVNVFVDVYTKE